MIAVICGIGFWGVAIFAVVANHYTKKIDVQPAEKGLAAVGPIVIFACVFVGAGLIASGLVNHQP